MKSKKLLYLSLIGLILCGCGNTTENGDNYSITPIGEEELKVNNIYDAVSKLQTMKNYTLSITMTDKEGSVSFDNIYAEKYYYCNYLGAEEGFIQDHNGVYRVNLYNNNLLASELYVDEKGDAYKDLWTSGVISNLTQLTLENYVPARELTTFAIPTKKDKLVIMDMLELDSIYYANLSNCEFKLMGSTMNNLYLFLEFTNGVTFSCAFNSFGKSIASEIIDFKAQGKTYTPISRDLQQVKELFQLNNYKRVCYENEDPSQRVIGYEWFTENYFYGDYIVDEYKIYELGYIGLKKKVKDGKEYDGAYLFMLDDTYTNYVFYDYAPAFTTSISYMPDIMNYPSKLVMFDYNLQFFEKMDDPTNYGKNVYVTTDLYIIQDWLTNFQISLSTENGEQAYIYDLRIITDLYSNESDCTVTFQFDYMIGDTVYGLQREFIDFNNSNIALMDEFYNSFENQ